MAKKKGFMSRMIEGPERSENYARSTLPSNRWALGWDIFKTNFSKIVLLNLILLAFAVPVIAIFIWRSMVINVQAMTVPFDSFMAYPYVGSLNGMAEMVQIQANLWSLVFLPVAAAVLAVGLSGVLYILRNMVWTEGVFVGSDFWRGVKKNYFIVLFILLSYSVVLFCGIMSIDMANMLIVTGEASAILMTVTKVITYVAIVFISIMVLHMLAMSVTYELSFFKLIRNGFILTLSLLPSNIFFAAFALFSALLWLLIPTIGVIVFIVLGMSAGLLIWTDYSHWIYDRFINEKVPGAKRNRGIYEKVGKESFGEDLSRLGEQSFDTAYLNKRPIKPITDYDIEIVELPTSFNREDLRRLEESKAAMRRDSDQYVEDVLSGKLKPDEDLSAFKEADEVELPDLTDGSEGEGAE